MRLYDSIYEYGEAEYIVSKSRFIAHAFPVGSYDEAKDCVSIIREEYRDATHNVPAIVCGPGQEYQWASDDGEPGGTSGMPVLKLLTSMGLTNIAMVITRYFGGIKLGTGGLARAYTAAARLGLEAAGICEVWESAVMKYSFAYTYLSKLQNLAADGKFEIADPVYSDTVTADIRCMSEYAEEVRGIIGNLTNGQCVLIEEHKDLIKIKKMIDTLK
jgi:uncharacterized YigZ family protein